MANPYPFMVPLTAQHAPGSVVSTAREVERRTGTRAYLNTRTQKILFCYRDDPSGGPATAGFEQCRESHQADYLVYVIQACKVDRRIKDRWAQSHHASEQHENMRAREKFLDDRRPDALDYAEFVDRKRRGTQTHVSV